MSSVAVMLQICSAFGLSSAAGLNAYVPLLAIGLLGRYQAIHLAGPYTILQSPAVLALLGCLALIDFVADKIPAVDHITHVVGMLINPIAGAIVFASQTHAISEVSPFVALTAGLAIAGGFHTARATMRPVATATTGGVVNPFLSLAEDVLAIVLSLLAIFIPILSAALIFAIFYLIYRTWKPIRSRIGSMFGNGGQLFGTSKKSE